MFKGPQWHAGRFGRNRVLHDSQTAAALDRLQSGRAIIEHSRQHHTDHAAAVLECRRSEQHVDGRTGKMLLRATSEPYHSSIEQQVMVGRSNHQVPVTQSIRFTTVTGGNPGLKPEKSTTLTLGTVLQPVRNLTIDLDSSWIYLKNQIVVGGLGYSTILQNAQPANQFANLITRDAQGQIQSISQANANLFKSSVSGLDIDARYGFDFDRSGRLTVLGNRTYFYKYATQNPDGSWSGQLDQGLNQICWLSGESRSAGNRSGFFRPCL